MNQKRFFEVASAALVIVVIVLASVSGARAASKYKTLHAFTGTDGVYPNLTVTFDAAGNLYGAACSGGAYGYGVVFKLAPQPDGSWTESALRQFNGSADGSCPIGGLIFDAAGNLYGVTNQGGVHGSGVVFKLVHSSSGSWAESVLYAFTGSADGSYPDCPLIFDAQGNLYGTVVYAGSYGWGAVFKLTPNSDGTWAESVLHAFTGGTDGGHPVTGLIFDLSGSLYGTTYWGGASGNGTAFKLTPNANGGWDESLLHTFTGGMDGAYPSGWLIFDAVGNLYGTTDVGGAYGDGVVFKIAPTSSGGWQETVLHQFTGGIVGGRAWGGCGLALDQAGNLYGQRWNGGAYGYGVVFKLAPTSSNTWKETVLHAFKDAPGALPDGGVTWNAAGSLYGTTSGDGSTTFGSVFEITP